jgi:ABC-type nitrate/sulfonate/bicarbonate transport system substrate-binding protein
MLRRELLQVGMSLAAAGTLAACSKKKGSGAGNTINIVNTSGTTNAVLAQLMLEMGYLKEFGITPNFLDVADGNQSAAALISGHADICPSAGFTQVLAAIARGAPLRLVGGGALKNFNAIMSANPAVRTLKDLEGRSVGIGALGAQLHQTMIALFHKFGVDKSKVRFANVGSSVDVFKAVKARVVDAGASEIWLQAGSGLHILEHGKTFESLPEYVNQAAFTSQFTIAGKREMLVRTLAAYAKLYRFIMYGDSKAAFLAASAKALGKHGMETALDQWNFYRANQPFAANLEIGTPGLLFMQNLNIETGTQKTVLPYDRIVDTSLANAAIKLIDHGKK